MNYHFRMTFWRPGLLSGIMDVLPDDVSQKEKEKNHIERSASERGSWVF